MTTLILVMLLMLLALIYLDATRQVESQSELLKDRSELIGGFLSLQNKFYTLSGQERPGELSYLLQQIHQMKEHFREDITVWLGNERQLNDLLLIGIEV